MATLSATALVLGCGAESDPVEQTEHLDSALEDCPRIVYYPIYTSSRWVHSYVRQPIPDAVPYFDPIDNRWYVEMWETIYHTNDALEANYDTEAPCDTRTSHFEGESGTYSTNVEVSRQLLEGCTLVEESSGGDYPWACDWYRSSEVCNTTASLPAPPGEVGDWYVAVQSDTINVYNTKCVCDARCVQIAQR